MFEIVTDALVVAKEPLRERDARVWLYTRELGGVIARATGAQKVLAKLSGHLEPLNFASVRLVQRRSSASENFANFQIADALTIHRSGAWRGSATALGAALRLIEPLKDEGFRGTPDAEIWQTLEEIFKNSPEPPFARYTEKFLVALGFNPRHSSCAMCAEKSPNLFSLRDLSFYCRACLPTGQAGLPLQILGNSTIV